MCVHQILMQSGYWCLLVTSKFQSKVSQLISQELPRINILGVKKQIFIFREHDTEYTYL